MIREHSIPADKCPGVKCGPGSFGRFALLGFEATAGIPAAATARAAEMLQRHGFRALRYDR